MFKLPTHLYSSELHEFDINNLADPRVNKLFLDQPIEMTGKAFTFWLKSFYTQNNLFELPDLIPVKWTCGTANIFPAATTFKQWIVSFIPEEYFWLLPLLELEFDDGLLSICHNPSFKTEENSRGATLYFPRILPVNRTTIDIYTRNSNGEPLDIKENAYELIENLFTPELLKRYEEALSTLENSRLSVEGNSYHTWKFYLSYFCGKTFTSINEQTFSAKSLLDSLQENPQSTLTCRYYKGNIEMNMIVPITKQNKKALHKVLTHSTNPLDYLPYPQVMPGEHSPPLFGVELELSSRWTPKQIIDATDEPFLIIKADSSITGEFPGRYELVTAPASMKVQRKQWAHFFNNINYDAFDTSSSTNNGMHVHLDRKNFKDPSHLQAFTWFINSPVNREFMIAVSERTLSSLNQFCRFLDISNTGNLHSNYSNVVDRCRGYSRYSAVNFQKRETIEVRFFKGIVSFATVIKNLEFLESALEFAHNRSIATNNLRSYFAWLEDTPSNKYMTLKKFYKEIDGIGFVEPSNVKELTWGLTNTRAIAKRIKDRKIPVTQKLVTLLNKGKKRVFVLNKKTGELETTTAGKGKISHLDGFIAARILGLKPDINSVIEK